MGANAMGDAAGVTVTAFGAVAGTACPGSSVGSRRDRAVLRFSTRTRLCFGNTTGPAHPAAKELPTALRVRVILRLSNISGVVGYIPTSRRVCAENWHYGAIRRAR